MWAGSISVALLVIVFLLLSLLNHWFIEAKIKPMFRLLPKTWQEWEHTLFFPFQAYVVVATLFISFCKAIWPDGQAATHALFHFERTIWWGYPLCLVVLLGIALAQFDAGSLGKMWTNLSLAALCAWLLVTNNFVIA